MTWAAAAADAAGAPSRPRRLHSLLALGSASALPVSVVRAGGGILLVSLVFFALLGSVDRGEPSGGAVKMPNLVKTTRAAREPEARTSLARPTKAHAWWTAFDAFPQAFTINGFEKPADLCRHLSELGYSRARWAESEVFKGEWECSSPLDRGNAQSRSFVLVRGAGETQLNSLMLKLTAPEDGERARLLDKAESAVRAFSQAAGLILAGDALPRLGGWSTGRTWTSQGTFTIAAENGAGNTRVVSLTAIPPLPRPAAADCREACRARFAFLAKRAAAERPVKSERRFMASAADAGPQRTKGLATTFGPFP